MLLCIHPLRLAIGNSTESEVNMNSKLKSTIISLAVTIWIGFMSFVGMTGEPAAFLVMFSPILLVLAWRTISVYLLWLARTESNLKGN